MATVHGRHTKSESQDQAGVGERDEVYDIPVPGRCRVARDERSFCRHVPFMPCYERQDIGARLRRRLSGVFRRRQPVPEHV